MGRISGAILLAAFVVGCGGAPEGIDGAGAYVLIDRTAREAGFRLEGVEARDSVLPVELTPGASIDLVGPSGSVEIGPGPGELAYVTGRSGRIALALLDEEVARDRLILVGTEEAALEVADQVLGRAAPDEAGRWVVSAPEAFIEGARGFVPEGLDEVVPARLDALEVGGAEALSATELLGAGRRLAQRAGEAPVDALLAAPAACDDPIEGLWVSRQHYPRFGDWYLFTLEVRRDAADPTTLTGTIRARSWSGTAETPVPGSCDSLPPTACGAGFDWAVRMDGRGRLDGERVRFEGVSFGIESVRCGCAPHPTQYMLDRFAGRLLADGWSIEAENDDGGRSIGDPHLFRRVACR